MQIFYLEKKEIRERNSYKKKNKNKKQQKMKKKKLKQKIKTYLVTKNFVTLILLTLL